MSIIFLVSQLIDYKMSKSSENVNMFIIKNGTDVFN